MKSSGNKGFDNTIAAYYSILDSGKSYGASPAGQAIQGGPHDIRRLGRDGVNQGLAIDALGGMS